MKKSLRIVLLFFTAALLLSACALPIPIGSTSF